ncbi:MAG TPA: hypothetical protein PLP63_06500 [Saprospiraceae bacterium]|nr:hypothetical protein [Saprospiraceae bacterium]
MSTKDILILCFVVILSCSISLFVGYKYLQKNGAPETVEMVKQRIEEQARNERVSFILDSLRSADARTINNIKRIYINSKKEIPIITDPDSLVNSINELDKILSK